MNHRQLVAIEFLLEDGSAAGISEDGLEPPQEEPFEFCCVGFHD